MSLLFMILFFLLQTPEDMTLYSKMYQKITLIKCFVTSLTAANYPNVMQTFANLFHHEFKVDMYMSVYVCMQDNYLVEQLHTQCESI